MKYTVKIAFCGIVSALGVAVLFLTGAVPVATIAMPAVAGCLIIPIVAECGAKWGGGVFLITAILSFFLSTDREAFLIYVLFFGYYPALYAVLDRIKNKAGRYVLKLLIFNIAVVAETLIATYILGVPIEMISFLGAFTPVVLLVLANAVFVLYDYALKGLILTYLHRLHPTARRILKIK